MNASNPQTPGAGRIRALMTQAAQAMQAGNAARSRTLMEQAATLAPDDPGINTNLGLVLVHQGELEAALARLDHAIKADPHLYPAVLHKGAVLERLGREREAVNAYARGLAQAGDLSRVPPGLQPVVDAAKQAIERNEKKLEAFIDERTAGLREQYGEAAFERVDEALKIRHGRLQRQTQQPTFLYFPGLPARTFYERDEFPFLAEIEAQTDIIRAEFLEILEQDNGFRPYVEKPDGVPLAQWAELNHSFTWSAYHLYKNGVLQEDNCARCPRTLQAVDALPLSRIPEHEPEVFFSLLKPGAHIPPHTGAINTRLVVHLPLIVPPRCRFRVGNNTREWREGESLIFDDTMEHEAWNNSDQLRAVFIFNIWNPGLTEAEREGVAALIAAMGQYNRA